MKCTRQDLNQSAESESLLVELGFISSHFILNPVWKKWVQRYQADFIFSREAWNLIVCDLWSKKWLNLLMGQKWPQGWKVMYFNRIFSRTMTQASAFPFVHGVVMRTESGALHGYECTLLLSPILALCFETVTRPLRLILLSRLDLNLWFSCYNSMSSKITGVCSMPSAFFTINSEHVSWFSSRTYLFVWF